MLSCLLFEGTVRCQLVTEDRNLLVLLRRHRSDRAVSLPCVPQHQRQWRSHMDASAPMLDCPDVLPKTSEPEWHGQMLTTLGEQCFILLSPALQLVTFHQAAYSCI